jgi:AcrR family transcriptional regulator
MSESLVARHPNVGPLLNERAQRAKLLEAMVQVVAEKGYAAATVADAVRVAKVSRGTFYELFESKQACLAEAYRLGVEVLDERIAESVAGAGDWLDEIRLGLRAYLRALEDEPRFARVHLLEWDALGHEREEAIAHFARRYGKSFEKGGRPVPPDDALFVLSAGIDQLVRARLRDGRDVTDLEDTLVGCAVRLATKEEPWT